MNIYRLQLYIAGCLFLSLFSACSKWLDVQPEDKFTEEQVFSTPAGFENAINGIYLGMADNNLYGAAMTMTTLELLAQRYSISSVNHEFSTTAKYGYTENQLKGFFEQSWQKLYKNIANANKIINNVNSKPNVLTADERDKLLGETYGMRAFMHFDLLRMFGPIYNSADSLSTSIPYRAAISLSDAERLSANKVMELIASDLKKAESILEKVDPIISQGVVSNQNVPNNNWRNYRMNYFAVKALQARVYLWRNDKENALKAAKVVIAQRAKFPWATKDVTINDALSPDRIFHTELLFALESPKLYQSQDEFFSANLQIGDILYPSADYLNTVYEGIENDFRYAPSWKVPATASYYKTFYKYADVFDATKGFRNTIPLIRLSEMYYIAAECATTSTEALDYLNTVRANRNLPNLLTGADLKTETLKEYRKEFFGEGQLWFYYKRNKATSILSSNNTVATIIDPALYRFPIPDSELDLNK